VENLRRPSSEPLVHTLHAQELHVVQSHTLWDLPRSAESLRDEELPGGTHGGNASHATAPGGVRKTSLGMGGLSDHTRSSKASSAARAVNHSTHSGSAAARTLGPSSILATLAPGSMKLSTMAA